MTDAPSDVPSDGPTAMRRVAVEREFAYPPARLWRALTEPRLLAEWLMRNDFVPTVGHRFTLTGEWGGSLDCEVLTIEPERRLAYTWNHAHDDPAYALTSVVTFTLTPTAAGTRLRVEQEGFRPGQRAAIGGAKLGWTKFLARLDETLADAA